MGEGGGGEGGGGEGGGGWVRVVGVPRMKAPLAAELAVMHRECDRHPN